MPYKTLDKSQGNLRISQDTCYVRMTDNNILTIYRQFTHLLNNKKKVSDIKNTPVHVHDLYGFTKKGRGVMFLSEFEQFSVLVF